ncbi:hypothetical protein B0H13DRAFT_1917515 [Mycena leptocephala]|nr:hypothetical protein B0H13DRAFT_1917515 [Mycena leptocephala]
MHLSEDDDGHEALLWALQAYIGLIAPWSAVRLKVLPLGITAELGYDCSPNIQYVEVTGRRAMVANASRDIQIGDELVCDYGKDFWGGVCPCKTCQMPNGSTPLPAQQTSIPGVPIVPATEEEQLELQRKKAEKRVREREQDKRRRVAKTQIKREANRNGN